MGEDLHHISLQCIWTYVAYFLFWICSYLSSTSRNPLICPEMRLPLIRFCSFLLCPVFLAIFLCSLWAFWARGIMHAIHWGWYKLTTICCWGLIRCRWRCGGLCPRLQWVCWWFQGILWRWTGVDMGENHYQLEWLWARSGNQIWCMDP